VLKYDNTTENQTYVYIRGYEVKEYTLLLFNYLRIIQGIPFLL